MTLRYWGRPEAKSGENDWGRVDDFRGHQGWMRMKREGGEEGKVPVHDFNFEHSVAVELCAFEW